MVVAVVVVIVVMVVVVVMVVRVEFMSAVVAAMKWNPIVIILVERNVQNIDIAERTFESDVLVTQRTRLADVERLEETVAVKEMTTLSYPSVGHRL